MLIPLWGARYYEQWLSLAAPALMAPGNIMYLHAHADFELAFLCKSQDLEFLQSNATIRQLGAQIRLKMITIDEFFPPHAHVSYGIPLTLAYAKGIQDLGEDGLGTFVMLLNADFVVSEGSLAQVLRRLDDGNHIVTAPSLRVIEHEVRPLLEDRLQKHAGPGCFAPRAMMALAERHLHQTGTHPHPQPRWTDRRLVLPPGLLAEQRYLHCGPVLSADAVMLSDPTTAAECRLSRGLRVHPRGTAQAGNMRASATPMRC